MLSIERRESVQLLTLSRMSELEIPDFSQTVNSAICRPVVCSLEGVERTVRNAWKILSPNPGPSVAIFGGIHGNEVCGVETIKYLLEKFSSGSLALQSGSLILALGNEEAIAQGVRYVGENMNRQFHLNRAPLGTAYERLRVEELKAILRSGITRFLDLHSTTSPTLPFAMVESRFRHRIFDLGFERIVMGWGELGDASVAGDTENFAAQHGAIGITMENGQHADPQSILTAREVSLRFLSRLDMLPQSAAVAAAAPQLFLLRSVQTLDDASFRYARTFSNLEPLKKGELIGSDNSREFTASTAFNPVIVLPGDPRKTKVGDNLYLQAELLY